MDGRILADWLLRAEVELRAAQLALKGGEPNAPERYKAAKKSLSAAFDIAALKTRGDVFATQSGEAKEAETSRLLEVSV